MVIDILFYFIYLVHYAIEPLVPIGNWIQTPIAPIPIGVVHGNTTTNMGTDQNIAYLVQSWLNSNILTGSGECAQHSRNDGVLFFIMHLAGIPLVDFKRDNNMGGTITVNPQQRPDFCAFHNGVVVLMAEENADGDIGGAEADIRNKFAWIPQLIIPFFIAFAFCFSRVKVIGIRRNLPIYTVFDCLCSTLADRLLFLRPAVNIARVLRYFIMEDLIFPIGLKMNTWHTRPSGKKLRLLMRGAEVVCHNVALYRRLLGFYNHCADVPYLERKVTQAFRFRRICLQPLGLSVLPSSMAQFSRAITCILTAVSGIHAHGYFHTDIRWPNIIQLDNGDWCVIDCYEVCYQNEHELRAERAVSRQLVNVQEWSARDDIQQIIRLFDIVFPYMLLGPVLNIANPALYIPLFQLLEQLDSLDNLGAILPLIPQE